MAKRKKNKYRFNPDTLTYERIKDPLRLRLYRFLRNGLIFFIAVCIINLLFSSLFYTPKMKLLERERDMLLLKYGILNNKINEASAKLAELKNREQGIYRPFFGEEPLEIQGIGNPFPESRYSYMSGDMYGTVMIGTWKGLDRIAREIYYRSRSLDTIQHLAANKEMMATAIPAIWPIDIDKVRRTSHYGGRMHPIYRRYIMHKGIDLGATVGDPIYATGNAVVKSINTGQAKRGYGKQILLDHGFGYQTRYAHLSSIDVVPGQKVKRGEIIGKAGNTGGSTGPHLHYEVIYMGGTVNPINYLKRDIDPAELERIVSDANAEIFETDLQ